VQRNIVFWHRAVIFYPTIGESVRKVNVVPGRNRLRTCNIRYLCQFCCQYIELCSSRAEQSPFTVQRRTNAREETFRSTGGASSNLDQRHLHHQDVSGGQRTESGPFSSLVAFNRSKPNLILRMNNWLFGHLFEYLDLHLCIFFVLERYNCILCL
jgi:hypothetical protein